MARIEADSARDIARIQVKRAEAQYSKPAEHRASAEKWKAVGDVVIFVVPTIVTLFLVAAQPTMLLPALAIIAAYAGVVGGVVCIRAKLRRSAQEDQSD